MKNSHLKNILLAFVAVFFIHFLFIYAKALPKEVLDNPSLILPSVSDGGDESEKVAKNQSLYQTLNLSQLGLSQEAFEKGIEGYEYFASNGKLTNSILTIIDFSRPSAKKRLFVIDMNNGKLLFHTYVAHGRNSGKSLATSFSNESESYKSSLGFYLTGETYIGAHGFSLRLLGQEKGINDNAFDRAIVMHSAAYVSESIIKMQGYAGRSFGCPALPMEMNKPIIDKIKEGSCVFLYSPDNYYKKNTTILKKLV